MVGIQEPVPGNQPTLHDVEQAAGFLFDLARLKADDPNAFPGFTTIVEDNEVAVRHAEPSGHYTELHIARAGGRWVLSEELLRKPFDDDDSSGAAVREKHVYPLGDGEPTLHEAQPGKIRAYLGVNPVFEGQGGGELQLGEPAGAGEFRRLLRAMHTVTGEQAILSKIHEDTPRRGRGRGLLGRIFGFGSQQ